MEKGIKLILGDVVLDEQKKTLTVKKISSIITCTTIETAESLGDMLGEKHLTYFIPKVDEMDYQIVYLCDKHIDID